MKRNAFGQLFGAAHPGLLLSGDGGDGGGEFKAPQSQEELDKILNAAVARTHKQYEPLKEKATKWDEHEAEANKPKPKPKDTPKPKDDESAASGVSEDDVDERINTALAARDLELGLERVNDHLDKALEGRTFAASTVLGLDRKQFVKDGKFADTEAIKDWVKENSKEIEQPEQRRRQIPGQGDRDSSATGGSVQSGRDIYNDQKPKSRKD